MALTIKSLVLLCTHSSFSRQRPPIPFEWTGNFAVTCFASMSSPCDGVASHLPSVEMAIGLFPVSTLQQSLSVFISLLPKPGDPADGLDGPLGNQLKGGTFATVSPDSGGTDVPRESELNVFDV